MKKRLLPLIVLILLTSVSFAQTRTILVTVPDATEAVYIAGVMNNWSPGVDTMTRISVSPKVYSFEFEMADTTDLKYKFLSGPDWKYQQVRDADFVYSRDSIAVVDAFDAMYKKSQGDSVTIEVLVPKEVVVLYLTGNFSNWTTNTNKMVKVDSTANGKEFKLKVYVPDTTILEFKFIAGPEWAYQQTNTTNYKYADGNIVECNAFDNIYDPNKLGNITLNITVPEGTAQVWIIGSFNQWTLENPVQATKNQDNTFTAIIPNVGAITYKCYSYPDWVYEEAIDEAGTSLLADRSASVAAGPEYDITVAFWKQLYVPTGVKDYETARNLIYTRNGSVIVEGVVEKVAVFDVQGRMVQDARVKGTFTSKYLNAGIYIIRVDGKTRKVLLP